MTKVAIRLVADQMRPAVHLTADYSFKPPHQWPQYIQRLIQMWLMRSVLYSQILGIEEPYVELLIEKIVTWGETFYPHLRQQQNEIAGYLKQKESYCWNLLEDDRTKGIVSVYLLGQLFHTYHCYRQDVERWAGKKGLTVDWEGYNRTLPDFD